jgi:hypothetical protein
MSSNLVIFKISITVPNGRGSIVSEKVGAKKRKTARNGPVGWPPWFGQIARKDRILRRSGRCSAPGKECPEWRDWRRERTCHQTLSGPFSMAYEPHKSRWMLTGESRPVLRRFPPGLACGSGPEGAICRTGLRSGVQHRKPGDAKMDPLSATCTGMRRHPGLPPR